MPAVGWRVGYPLARGTYSDRTDRMPAPLTPLHDTRASDCTFDMTTTSNEFNHPTPHDVTRSSSIRPNID